MPRYFLGVWPGDFDVQVRQRGWRGDGTEILQWGSYVPEQALSRAKRNRETRSRNNSTAGEISRINYQRIAE
jgi:hypothetical protein